MLKTFFVNNKPVTIFDAKNKEHRRAFYEFHTKKSWGDCQFRFILEEPYSNLVECIQHKMLDHYVGKEFDKRPKG